MNCNNKLSKKNWITLLLLFETYKGKYLKIISKRDTKISRQYDIGVLHFNENENGTLDLSYAMTSKGVTPENVNISSHVVAAKHSNNKQFIQSLISPEFNDSIEEISEEEFNTFFAQVNELEEKNNEFFDTSE
jgi:hypothetical protein